MQKTEFISFRVSPEMRKQAEERAKAAGIQIADLCRASLKAVLDDKMEVKL